jgi:hypothetical protein
VGEAVEVEVLWRDGITFPCVRPGFVVADRTLSDGVARAGRPLHVTAATKVLELPC